MKANISGYSTEIFPTDAETLSNCHIGEGENCCVLLTMGAGGWECMALQPMGAMLRERASEGRTMAKRTGCTQVDNFNPEGLLGMVTVPEFDDR
jgi:hypothetical protein